MTTRSVSNRHVRQVAKLVQRLNRDEIRVLLRLVPQLRAELQTEAAVFDQPDDLAQWAQAQMARHSPEARPMQAEDIFLDDKTVAEYFALPDAERERIWAELYAAAIESAPEREVKLDATIPAG
jgi:hypothetical protein